MVAALALLGFGALLLGLARWRGARLAAGIGLAAVLFPLLVAAPVVVAHLRCAREVTRAGEGTDGLAWRIVRETCPGSDRRPFLVEIRARDARFWRLAAEFDPPFTPETVEVRGDVLHVDVRGRLGGRTDVEVAISGGVPTQVGGYWSEPRVFGMRF